MNRVRSFCLKNDYYRKLHKSWDESCRSIETKEDKWRNDESTKTRAEKEAKRKLQAIIDHRVGK
jgi:hypothetical protein